MDWEVMPEQTTANKNSNLSVDIVAALKERIIRWEYLPGHRFTEEELCHKFGVSRSPVREALRMLAANGLIVQTPHRGYQVKQLDMREIYELYEVRLALEMFVVERLAEQGIAQEVINELKQTWSAIQQAPAKSSEELAGMDEAFHETLAQVLDNKTLLQQLHAINERLFILRMIDFTSPERTTTTSWQHIEILDRIVARDIPGARAAIRKNIEDGRSNVETSVKGALARAYLNQVPGL
jgi:DNA-binding GntR family transcriptional regulator